jgi:hypothetical protein
VGNATYKGIRKMNTKFWLEYSERNTQLGRPKCTSEESIKMRV